jgi:hypothetical protein
MEDPLNPIMEILDCRRTISEYFTEIHLFLDHNRILIPQDIDDIFGAATQNLDAIIRHANELQNIGEDQINIIDSLQILLDESFERTNRLDQKLINILLIKEMAANIGRILPKIFRESVIKVGEMLTDCYSAIMPIQNVGEEGMQVVLIRLKIGKVNIGTLKHNFKILKISSKMLRISLII